MSKDNGKLPDYLLFPDDSGKWHLTDNHGNPLYDDLNLSRETLVSLAEEAGQTYKILNPRQHIAQQQKGTTNDGTPQNRNNHD